MSSYSLSVCAEMVFLELPFVERVKRIHELGFGVEIWHWWDKDIAALVDTGARFTSMSGYITGDLTSQEGVAALLESAERSLEAAARLDCPSLNLHGTGLDEKGLPVAPKEIVSGEMWLTAKASLDALGALGEQAGKVFVLENLNTAVDHPGTPFAKAADTLALVKAVNNPHVRMNLDLYHAQIGEGNLIELIRQSADYLGEVQVADVPGRQQPGTGEINYRAIAKALRDIGYQGVVAFEGWASHAPEKALEEFREAFSL
ncbi:TIM barrel protein [Carnimonas nigrificans]|uniref:TIM barrel protein n=1 Tax=Carnimonas nigrificans TaxID=64323 RepID=UPI00046F18FD|nr:TIM barrel protein [Carnimonas nigrificans]